MSFHYILPNEVVLGRGPVLTREVEIKCVIKCVDCGKEFGKRYIDPNTCSSNRPWDVI